jgi:predicted nucleotidyltransferase
MAHTTIDLRSSELRRGRTLHVIDVENLVGTPYMTADDAGWVMQRYRLEVAPLTGDLAVVACNPGAAFEVKPAWPDALFRVRAGEDGADLALLAELHTGDISRRFARVVIASGDHIFSAAAWTLRSAGVVIAVAVGRGALSSDLRRAASAIYDLHLDVAPAA